MGKSKDAERMAVVKFERTGCDWVDGILEALEDACGDYQDVGDWTASGTDELSYVDHIDAATSVAARHIDALKKQNKNLRAACETFVLWMDREDGKVGRPPEGWGEIRKTPEGERRWRQWYDENIRICDLACTKAREALGVI